MIDLHTHVLPGIDDGPAELAGSMALVDAAARDGVEVLCATPHLRADFPAVHVGDISDRCAELEAASGNRTRIVPGGEVSVAWAGQADDAALRLASLSQRGSDLLVETPYDSLSAPFEELLFDLAVRGYRVVLAHPERNPSFQRKPARLRALLERGVLVQVTASALVGARRSPSPRLARALVAEGAAHVLASDAHAANGVRRAGLSAAVGAGRRLAGARAEWMVTDAPAAILAGEPLPPPPAGR